MAVLRVCVFDNSFGGKS